MPIGMTVCAYAVPMTDTVVRRHRRHPWRGDGCDVVATGERVVQGLSFVVMVAPSCLVWSVAVHLAFYRP